MSGVNVKEHIAAILERFSNIEFQKEVWLNSKYFDIYAVTLNKGINTLDDFGFFDDVESCSLGVLSLDELDFIRIFANGLLAYDEPQNIASIFKDQKWLDIVEQAKKVLLILEGSGYFILREK